MIRILWPTIRPEVALKRATEWANRSVCRAAKPVFWFGINDGADIPPEMGASEFGSVEFGGAIGGCPCYAFRTGTVLGVTHSATVLSRRLAATGNMNADPWIIVLASDDYEAPQGWDECLRAQFGDHNGALIVNDGYKPGTNIVPLPVIRWNLFERMNGVIYNPSFRHMFCDQEMFDVITEMGAVRDLRGTAAPVFHHRHWTFNGRDRDHHDMRNTEWWNEDKATYEKRRLLPLQEKLKLPEGWTP